MSTEAIDDYLKIIFALTREGGQASTGEIARHLNLAPASVTGMIKKLAAHEPPLVIYTKSRGVRLSLDGRSRALEIIRHHRLLETFLHDTLGIGWDKVHEEAERLEHYISEDLEEAIARHLGDPVVDPHGSPIPDRDGHMPRLPTETVLDLEPGHPAHIVRICSEDFPLRRYLEEKGIVPGVEVQLESIEPFGGPVLLLVAGQIFGLSQEVASRLHVTIDDKSHNS